MERKERIIDLEGLAEAFRGDLRVLADPAGSTEPPAPFAKLAAAARELGSRARELQATALAQRRKHVEARSEILARPLVERKEELEQRVERRQEAITAPAKGKFIVAGRVVDAKSGTGLAGALVRVLERDPLRDDVLGEVRTDGVGFYHLEYTLADFRDLFERRPETYIQIVDDEGRAVYTSDRSFRHKAGKVEILHAAVDGSELPKSLERGRAEERRAAAEIGEMERQARALESRRAIRTGLLQTRRARAGAPAAVPPPAGHDISRIKGVGPVLRSRLKARGISDAAEVVSMASDHLAEVLEVTEGQAQRIQHEARRLVGL